MIRTYILIVCTFLSMLCAASNNTISFQGKLLDSTGAAITATKSMTYTLYTASTGGSAIGSAISLASVPVNSGVYSVELDVSTVSLPNDVWVEVQVGGETLSPRIHLTSSAFAQKSATANYAVTANQLSSGVFVNAGGNVGVGTTSPAKKMQVEGTFTAATLNSYLRIGASPAYVDIGREGGGSGWVGTPFAHNFILGANSQNIITLTSAGTVGIGTQSPAAQLEVASTGTALRLSPPTGGYNYIDFKSGFSNNMAWSINDGVNSNFSINRYLASTGVYQNSPLYILNSNGYVGIGTTSPSKPLDINGNLRVGGGGQWTPATEMSFYTDGNAALPLKVGSIMASDSYSNANPGIGNIVADMSTHAGAAGTTLGLYCGAGSLPGAGYVSMYYPTVKTAYPNMYFSAGGQYSAWMSSSGVWTANSDRNKKTNFKFISKDDYFNRISQFKIYEWEYKTSLDKSKAKHIGPFAQDMHKYFDTYEEKMLSPQDTAGTALLGVQHLVSEAKEVRTSLNVLEEQNKLLKQQIAILEKKIDTLEKKK